jgi:hypothetical protein
MPDRDICPHHALARVFERIPFRWNRNTLSILSLAHVVVGQPASTSPEHALVGEPVPTSPGHALGARP